MQMTEWIDGLPKGELTRISASTGVPVARFYEAAKNGVKTTRHARRLSAATGGAVSVATLLRLSPEEACAAEAAEPHDTSPSIDPLPPAVHATAKVTALIDDVRLAVLDAKARAS